MPIPAYGFTARFPQISSTLRTPAHIGSPFDPKFPLAKGEHKPFGAIWDTGATRTVISQNVVQACDLTPTGMAEVYTASRKDIVPTYLVSLGLPNRVIIPILRVTQGFLTGTDVLIGMDIISQGDFAVTNYQGKTTFSFRMPSITEIDFAPQKSVPSAQHFPVVGRNEPCPCGSGKKYKKCHGKLSQSF